jgi:hypothetical protein
MFRSETISTAYIDDALVLENNSLKNTIDNLLTEIENNIEIIEPIKNENIFLRRKVECVEFKYISILKIINYISDLWKQKEKFVTAFYDLKIKFKIAPNNHNPIDDVLFVEYIQYCSSSSLSDENINWFETQFIRKYLHK